MKTLKTSLIISAIQSDIFNETFINSYDCDKISKNLKQLIHIIKIQKHLPILLIFEENKNLSFQKLLAKYLKKNKYITIISEREARAFKEQAICFFFFHKKFSDKIILDIAKNSYSFPLLFNEKKRNNSFIFKGLGNFSNYKHYLFLIAFLENIRRKKNI